MKDLELREYQKRILNMSEGNNTLVVLPTGLGKTFIALALAKRRMDLGRVIFLAPTKPLCVQHQQTFKEFGLSGMVMTGEIPPKQRKWDEELIFSTPQTLRNDLKKSRASLKNVALVVFDEAHRAVGDYAYVQIAKRYLEEAANPRVLALTASPGDTRSSIREICDNLGIKKIEYRDEESKDVAPYLKEKKWKTVEVELSPEIGEIVQLIEKSIESKVDDFARLHFPYKLNPKRLSKKQLIFIQQSLSRQIPRSNNPLMYRGVALVASLIKLSYCLELVQAQSLGAFVNYFNELESQTAKSSAELVKDPFLSSACEKALVMTKAGKEHPKFDWISRILDGNKKAKAMVFTNYVFTARKLNSYLRDRGFASSVFIGQRKGLTQKEQLKILSDFREGVYDVLISTSIGEEGLHVPSVDLGIFFEPVPSALRTIQRRGRVGRTTFGEIFVMYTKGGVDEKYYWVAQNKKKNMKNAIEYLSKKYDNE